MIITRHAAERFAERVRPVSLTEATKQLKGFLGAAILEKEDYDGDAWYRVGGLRLVVFNEHVMTCYFAGG